MTTDVEDFTALAKELIAEANLTGVLAVNGTPAMNAATLVVSASSTPYNISMMFFTGSYSDIANYERNSHAEEVMERKWAYIAPGTFPDIKVGHRITVAGHTYTIDHASPISPTGTSVYYKVVLVR